MNSSNHSCPYCSTVSSGGKKKIYVFPLLLTLILLQDLKVFVRKTEKLEWQKIVSIDFFWRAKCVTGRRELYVSTFQEERQCHGYFILVPKWRKMFLLWNYLITVDPCLLNLFADTFRNSNTSQCFVKFLYWYFRSDWVNKLHMHMYSHTGSSLQFFQYLSCVSVSQIPSDRKHPWV